MKIILDDREMEIELEYLRVGARFELSGNLLECVGIKTGEKDVKFYVEEVRDERSSFSTNAR